MKNLLKIAVAVMICILLVGCGNNVSGNVVASQKPIKIGYIGPLTGDAASLAVSSVRSIMMVEKEINSQGGINGRELQVIYEDGKCNGKDASLAAQKLININKVGFLIVGCSPEVLSIAPITEAAKVVMISPMATNPKIKEAGDYTFRVVPSDAGQGKIGAKLMLAADLSNVAVIYPNMDWGVGLKDVFVEEFEKSGKVVAAETFEMETKDVKTQLLKIKETKPDGIYMLAFAKQAGIILQQMNEIGLDIPVYAADASKDDTIL
ncbi:ABC transporter substrate-binding protein, partial [Candidatus Woesearchaeota archaeon]|nr:ABC transporter substrate-binding protein [Candidatus Woesearchaeota archaeon]